MKVALLLFPLVTASSLVVPTTMWVATVSFGHLLSTIVAMPGPGGWVTMVQMCTGRPAISGADFPSAA